MTAPLPPPLPAEVVRRVTALRDEAAALGLPEDGTAIALATADATGRPSVRTVLARAFDARGFVVYTNLGSRKARQIGENPRAALVAHWFPLGVQVSAEGPIAPVDDAEADAYWATRPRESRLGAYASRQSDTLSDRETLERRVREAEERFAGSDPPRPAFWSGLRLHPERLEIWRAGDARLHEREVWEVVDGAWRMRRLYP